MRDAAKRARRLTGRIVLPDPWSVEQLCGHVAAGQQRPIHLLGRPAHGDSITATMISTATAHYIFCRDDLRGIHRDHAICHELGHLIAGHTDRHDIFGIVEPPVTVLHRNCDYGADHEQQAEAIADAIMQRVSQRLGGPHDRRSKAIIHGFGEALR